jgi:putative sterol carrier protein
VTSRVGKYEVRDIIRTGSTGVVHLGYQEDLDRLVAIKELSPRPANDGGSGGTAASGAPIPHVLSPTDQYSSPAHRVPMPVSLGRCPSAGDEVALTSAIGHDEDVVRFLSDEWLAELSQAVATDEQVSSAASGIHLTVQQVVVTDSGDEVRYVTRVDDGRVWLEPGPADDAHVTITEDYGTAAALARGATTPQDAILAGKVRVSGDVGALLKGQEVLERVRACFDDVRARTEY